MSTLVRQLIAFDILKQELEECEQSFDHEDDENILTPKHLQLLEQCLHAKQHVLHAIKDMSEYDFANHLEQLELDSNMPSKQLLGIHFKLLAWAIDFVKAKKKADAISDEDFSERAEVRLDLWQTKAAKAKNQMKTLAQALGADEYLEFVQLYKLNHTELASLFVKK